MDRREGERPVRNPGGRLSGSLKRYNVNIPDVVVIGGGVCGCALARELRLRGASVKVMERDEVSAHASGKSWGGLYPASGAGIPGPLSEPARAAGERHRELYEGLVEETGIDYQLAPVESIALADGESGFASLQAEEARLRGAGYTAEILTPASLYELEPGIVPGMTGGLLQGCQQELDSRKFTRALAESARFHGAEFMRGNAVSVRIAGRRVEGVFTESGEMVEAGCVVIATGPWAGSSLSGAELSLPIRPVKGEILRLRLAGDGFRRRIGMGGYNVGRKPDGLVWAGTTEWEVGFDEAPSAAGREDILSGVSRYVAGVGSGEVVEHTACLRPVSPDGLPIVGGFGPWEDLYALAGAGKKGVLLSLVLAEMLAGLILVDRAGMPVPPELSPERFGL